MQLINTNLREILGRRIRIKKVSNPEGKFLEGLTGKVTNPFRCFGEGGIIGVFLDTSSEVPNDICNLTLKDEIDFV